MSDKARRVGAVGLGAVILVVLITAIVCILCIRKVPVGYEGTIYSIRHGLREETVGVGWHMLKPTEKLNLFTVSNEQLLLTKDEREGSKEDESFKVATSDNASMAISFQMTYRFIPEKIVKTYSSYKMDGTSIVNTRVRTVLKAKVSEVTTDYSLMDIYSGNRAAINEEITEYLNKSFQEQYGLEVIDASIIDVHPDEKLQTAIDSRVEAQQKADQAKAEQATAKVEAETALIKAQNEAEIKRVEAEAEADIVKIEAQAEAEANNVVAASITDQLIKMKEAEARLKHGWVTVKGSSTVVTDASDDTSSKKSN